MRKPGRSRSTKKAVVSRWSRSVAAMITAIRARGFEPADDNEADAIAILLWALNTNGGIA